MTWALWGSNGHVTDASRDPSGQTCDPNMLRAQYLENSWRCNLATLAK